MTHVPKAKIASAQAPTIPTLYIISGFRNFIIIVIHQMKTTSIGSIGITRPIPLSGVKYQVASSSVMPGIQGV